MVLCSGSGRWRHRELQARRRHQRTLTISTAWVKELWTGNDWTAGMQLGSVINNSASWYGSQADTWPIKCACGLLMDVGWTALVSWMRLAWHCG